MKLEPKHLAPYLPYGLKVMSEYNELSDIDTFRWSLDGHLRTELNLRVEVTPSRFRGQNLENIKPVLRPLSDLTKEIEVNGEKFIPIEYIEETFYTLDLHKQCERIIEDDRWINHCDYLLIKLLFQWHFDVFGLIEKGLAIDINTLKDE